MFSVFLYKQARCQSIIMENREKVASEIMQKTLQMMDSPEPSCVSLKSDRSLHHPPDLSDKPVTSDPR